MQQRPQPVDDPKLCPSSAIIDPKDYELEELKDKKDKTFHEWSADMAVKYPELKDAYIKLLECWNYYRRLK